MNPFKMLGKSLESFSAWIECLLDPQSAHWRAQQEQQKAASERLSRNPGVMFDNLAAKPLWGAKARYKLIEEMARAIDKDCDKLHIPSIESISRAKDALRAIEVAGFCVVPQEITDEMHMAADDAQPWGERNTPAAYRAMIKAGKL